jgi:hypothetical protein
VLVEICVKTIFTICILPCFTLISLYCRHTYIYLIYLFYTLTQTCHWILSCYGTVDFNIQTCTLNKYVPGNISQLRQRLLCALLQYLSYTWLYVSTVLNGSSPNVQGTFYGSWHVPWAIYFVSRNARARACVLSARVCVHSLIFERIKSKFAGNILRLTICGKD